MNDFDADAYEHMYVPELVEEHLADRSPWEWWNQDHVVGSHAPERLNRALAVLVSLGFSQGELLDDLREIEDLSGGDQTSLRKLTRRLIEIHREAASLAERVHGSSLAYSYPVGDRISPQAHERSADSLERALRDTRKTPMPQRDRMVREFIRRIDRKVRERGAVGKRRADEVLALLLTEVTGKCWTPAAIRMERSRSNRKRGVKRNRKSKAPTIRMSRTLQFRPESKLRTVAGPKFFDDEGEDQAE